MADRSKIEWTDASWNPVRARVLGDAEARPGWHCVHVSEGCRNCYAESVNNRFGTKLPYTAPSSRQLESFIDEKALSQPLRWKLPRKIFLGSMTDVFGDWVTDAMLDRIFAVMALANQHTYQVLTKRPERMRQTIARIGKSIRILEEPANALGYTLIFEGIGLVGWPLSNVWLGVSVEDQATADARIPLLLETPAAKRFVSYEPALGSVDFSFTPWPPDRPRFPDTDDISDGRDALRAVDHSGSRIDWIIAGGESGPNARPTHPDWFRSVRNQCAAAGVAFFFKQWGEWAPRDDWADLKSGRMQAIEKDGSSTPYDQNPDDTGGQRMARAGKRTAGALLDGREHREFPE